MSGFRDHILRHRALAAWLFAAALLMKLLVPAGFMPVVAGGTITIEICSGHGPQRIVSAMPVMSHGGDHDGMHRDKKGGHGAAEMPCAFGGLTAPVLAATDPIVLALAIVFVLAGVFRVAPRLLPTPPSFLRPPLRAPPIPA